MSEKKINALKEAGTYKIIRVQPTPNPDAFQFILNGKVIGGGTKTFDSPDDVGNDPLAKALFEIFGIQSIYLKENFVTITKSNTVGWHTLMEKPDILWKNICLSMKKEMKQGTLQMSTRFSKLSKKKISSPTMVNDRPKWSTHYLM